MMKDKKIKVLLIEGFARQCMPLVRAIHELGCELTTLNNSKFDIGYLSRYPDRKIINRNWDRDDENKSYQCLLEEVSKYSYDVIIPLTDFSATICSKHKNELLQFTKPAVNEWEIFQIASNKQKTMDACAKSGVPSPKTIPEPNTVEEIIDSGLSYPIVIKPQTGYGSIGFNVVYNEKELREIFLKEKAIFQSLLVQEYIPQTDMQYKAEAFVDNDGNVKGIVVMNKTRWYPIDGGSTCCSETVDKPDIVEYTKTLLKAIKWRGYADLDFIQDPRDNKAKVMEINPRITASVKICFMAGVDFAKQIIELETGKEVTNYNGYIFNKRLRYFHTDLLWFLKSPNRFNTKPSWFNWIGTKDQIASIHDPLPWFGYTIEGLKKFRKESEKRRRK